MDKGRFQNFLEKNVLSIFTGSSIAGEEESTVRDALVAQGSGGSLLVKFSKTDDYRIVIKRLHPFKNFEVSLVRAILTEMIAVYTDENTVAYLPALQNYIIEKAICRSVSEVSYLTLLSIVAQMTKWGSRTYEGQNTRFGFLVSNKNYIGEKNPNMHISKFLPENFSAVLADGINTCMLVSADGYLMDFLNVPIAKDKNINAPFDYVNMASMSSGSKIGISLCPTGDILMFHEKTLVYAKKSGIWIRYSHEEVVERIADRTSEIGDATRKAIYLTSLDVSFARVGGCVVHLDKDNKEVLKHIDETNILIEDYYNEKCNQKREISFFTMDNAENTEKPLQYSEFIKQPQCLKAANLRKIIAGKKFYELSRKFREELLSIDGATIIGNDGEIIAVGAIVMIEAGGFSGGRLAAAKTLAKFGVSIKISNDGQIQGFKMDKFKLRSTPIFMLG